MRTQSLDSTDRQILHFLQRDARNNTTAQIGDEIGVSASTVATRIRKLEDEGVIIGYHPSIDYERAGYDHHLLAIGTAPFGERHTIADEVCHVTGVVNVRELLTSEQNVSVELVGDRRQDIEDTLDELDESGLHVERVEMMKRERALPFNHFGAHERHE